MSSLNNWIGSNPSKHCRYDERTQRCRKKKNREKVSVTLFNSGQGLSYGDTDPNFVVVFTSDGGSFPRPAFVTYNATWSENDEVSAWISYSVESANNYSFGVTTVRTDFDLTGFDPRTMSLTLEIQVDDSLEEIYLNSDPLNGGNGLGMSIDPPGNDIWHVFTIDTGFQSGINSLYFYWRNLANVSTGLRVRMSGSAVKY